MKDYELNKELLLSITDVLRTMIPLFSALVASYLTYKFARKDKIRDHLFTYKVKSYSALVEGVIQTRRELEKIRNANYLNQPSIKKKSSEIWDEFRKVTAEQALFLNEKTSEDLLIVNDAIFSVVLYESLNPLFTTNEKKQENENKLKHAIYECNQFVKKVQKELQINQLNNNQL